jgi:hypothetical protein
MMIGYKHTIHVKGLLCERRLLCINLHIHSLWILTDSGFSRSTWQCSNGILSFNIQIILGDGYGLLDQHLFMKILVFINCFNNRSFHFMRGTEFLVTPRAIPVCGWLRHFENGTFSKSG